MQTYKSQVGFHYNPETYLSARAVLSFRQDTEFSYTFENFFHPFVAELLERLNMKSVGELLDPKFHADLARDFFTTFYTPHPSDVVKLQYFRKDIDLRDGGPYANYNWELLFHIPLTIAVHLSKNQRFAEARRWFHYIFDPTSTEISIPAPQRYWKFLRFRQATDVQQIEELLVLLSKPDAECTPTELDLKAKVTSGYQAIKDRPFQPHAVARTRTIAYQYCVLMKYWDNELACGDYHFAQDTIESINVAEQHYALVATMLGRRPDEVPSRGLVRPRSFAQLKAAGLDAMGNALVELEGQFPLNLALPQTGNATDGAAAAPLFGIGRTLYFCIPRNEKLLSYWDTVADRLYKIRHCMNIKGIVRQLALFDPPLDPALLVKAAAAGIDVGSIVSGMQQPLAPVRAPLLIQKALELAGEVRGLGAALLSAIEKGDTERIAILRQQHEIRIQQLAQDVRFLQWKQAEASTDALLRTRASALERYRYYQRLLGLTPDGSNAPDTLPLDRRQLTEENFDEAFTQLVAQYDRPLGVIAFPRLRLSGDTSPSAQSGASGTGTLRLITNEAAELNTHLPTARDTRLAASVAETIGTVLTFVPEINVNLHFWGIGASSKVFGGSKLSDAAKIAAEILRTISGWEQDQAGMAARTAQYERRADDWTLQSNLAARELVQIGRQILTSLVAEQVAHHEYLNIQTQIAQAQEMDQALRSKFSNDELYAWMQGELSRLFYEYYRFAVDTARKAERAVKFELMRPEVDTTDFVRFNYWDGGRKGLLSGEALYLDVKRMEVAYLENNTRELEMTRHVSIRQLDPLALLAVRASGTCEVTIPEALYDRECAGHYMRRIKSIGLSIPSVVGPFTSVNCTLTLLRSTVRTKPDLKEGGYARLEEDDRFLDYVGATQTVVTSGGSNDSGLFETNLRDDRPLPFERAGACGTWRIELPAEFRAFDYSTISDVILHVRYTARQGGSTLAARVREELREILATANQSGLALLFNLRQDFPTEWSAFVNGAADFAIRLRKEQFAFMVQEEPIAIDGLALYTTDGNRLVKRTLAVPAGLADELNGPERTSTLTFIPDDNVLQRVARPQVFLVVRYRLDT